MTTVLVDQPEEGVTRVTLHRPDRLNAMNAELIGELHAALAALFRSVTGVGIEVLQRKVVSIFCEFCCEHRFPPWLYRLPRGHSRRARWSLRRFSRGDQLLLVLHP